MKTYIGNTRYKILDANGRRIMIADNSKPYDAEIEYLESTGTQYIDTGIPFTDDITFTIDKIRLQNDVNSGFLGYRFVNKATVQGNMRFFFAYADGRIGARFGVSVSNTSSSISKNTFHKMYFSGNNLSIDDIDTITIRQKYTTINYGNIYLFKCNTDNYYSEDVKNFYGAIGSSRIAKNGELIRNYIAVRKNGIGYLYDKVSGQLFGNSGTGNFILGNDK